MGVLLVGWGVFAVVSRTPPRATITSATVSTIAGPTSPNRSVAQSPTSGAAATPTTAGPTSTTDPARQATRAQAGAVLRSNPAIAFAPAAVADLVAGDVDSRLMAVLAVMADNVSSMQVYAFSGPRPRRTIDLSAADPGKVEVFLNTQQPPFKPRITRSGSSLHLMFPPDLTCRQRLNPEECP